ncbi:glucose receptor git3 protein [Purpureocillium lavendulum]|uniref:Glucose receptor git3 protein n=1 Tax=Purpureocillium lavendulum TaxID=1247861 RepID=A0AB34FBG6_9HYPO|nr:glucose receptor git3 protein [Purpureocillium lavendulum]
MASAYKRKRHTDPPETSPPAKRCKFTRRHRATPFAPSFWDNLSKVSLTSLALREIDRRNEEQQHLPIPAASEEVVAKDVARFARHGGPDLRHLRGFQAPQAVAVMSATPSSTNPRSRQTQSTGATSVTPRSRKSSAYDKNFEAHLAENGVHMNNRRSKPNNAREIQSELAKERASLSPSKFSDGAFETFQRQNEDAVFEADVMATVVPRLCGTSDIHSKQNVLFTELNPITDESAVKPKPDFFDGAHLLDLSPQLREDENLRATVIPTKHLNVPVAPNFFFEAKGPDGSAIVAQRQACYVGGYGARAMRDLQNSGETEPGYDGNAYTFSSTYHDGLLKLYTHHVTAPSSAEGRSEYHMTQLDTWGMTGNIDSFRRGVTAFRNARDMAERYRGTFIRAANTRAAPAATVGNAGVTVAYEETSASAQLEAFESADPSECSAWQDADNALQQLIADGEGDGETLQGEAETTAVPRYLRAEEDSQNLSQDSGPQDHDDPSLSFASSFTSFDTETRSKRPRRSPSPPTTKSKRALPSTKGKGADTRQSTQPCAPTAPLSSDSGESHWVQTYAHRGKICFKNTEQEEGPPGVRRLGRHDIWVNPKSDPKEQGPISSQGEAVRYASIAGAAAVFQKEICDAIEKVAIQCGEPELRASITIEFPKWGVVDCLLSMHICNWAVKYFAKKLFGAEVVWLDSSRHITLEGGITIIVPGTEFTMKGTKEDAILEVFGSEALNAIKESPVRSQELRQGSSITECVSMILIGEGAVINLALGLEMGMHIWKKLYS